MQNQKLSPVKKALVAYDINHHTAKGWERLIKRNYFTIDKVKEYKGSLDALAYDTLLNGQHIDISIIGSNFGIYATRECEGIGIRAKGDFSEMKKSAPAIEKMLELLCEKFNVKYTLGEKVGIEMIDTFKEMTFLDWCILYQKIVSGKMHDPYKSIASKGVNREYLITWINKYLDDKWQTLNTNKGGYQENKVNPEIGIKSGELLTMRRKKQIRRNKLEDKARKLRADQEKPSYKKLLFQFIYVHYSSILKDSVEDRENLTKSITKAIGTKFRSDYKPEFWKDEKIGDRVHLKENGLGLEDYLMIKVHGLINESKQIIIVEPYKLFRSSFSIKSRECTNGELAVCIWGEGSPNCMKSILLEKEDIIHTSALILSKIPNHRWIKYLEVEIKSNNVPLTKKEFLSITARKTAYGLTGKDYYIETINKKFLL